MKLIGNQRVEVEVSKEELANALQKIIIEDYFDNDLEEVGSIKKTTRGLPPL